MIWVGHRHVPSIGVRGPPIATPVRAPFRPVHSLRQFNWYSGLYHRIVANSSFYPRPGQMRVLSFVSSKLNSRVTPAGPMGLLLLTYDKNSGCRKRKDRPDWGSNLGLPLFMKGTLTTQLPTWVSWRNCQPAHWSDVCFHCLAYIARLAS